MISAKLALKVKNVENVKTVKNWWKADWAKMREELRRTDWTMLEEATTDQAWESVRNRVERLIEKHVPNKPRGQQGRPPWMNRQILKEVRKKHRMWRKEDARNVSAEYRAVVKKV
jgi:hypothetical protein